MAAIFTLPYDDELPFDAGCSGSAGRTGRARPGSATVIELDRHQNRHQNRDQNRARQSRRARGLDVRRAIRRRNAAVLAGLVAAFVATVFCLAVGFAVVDSLSQAPAVTPVTGPGADHAGGVIVVQSGDTLTSIARDLQPTGDISALVDRLAAVHGPAPLQAGDRLPIGELGIAVGDLAS